MGATIQQDEKGIWVMHASGALRKEELDAVQSACLEALSPNDNVKLLVMVDRDFRGWVGESVWNDMTFFVKHGNRIEKIAIVGDTTWEARMLMFVGAGFRKAPVKYFTPEQRDEAYAWLG
ncbi:MAG TPA: STAS/SEC14 domain-containing protein [Geobacteraceae bacterium]